MDRAIHILIAFGVVVLLWLPSWRLKVYSRSSGHTPLVALTGRAALADILLFTYAYAWFGLFNLRILLFFIAAHEASIILIHLIWRASTPEGVEWRYAYLRMYGELRYSRRWLFNFLTGIIILSSVGASIVLCGGFIIILHHPDYPAFFSVVAVSGGLSLSIISLASAWMLIHPALENEARTRLLLDLCNGWIIVFICTAMAGTKAVVPKEVISLLPRPYHLQFPLSPLIIAGIVLVSLSVPMFLGGNRRTGEVKKIDRFERDMLDRLNRVNSPTEDDKISSFSEFLEKLRVRTQSFQHQTPPPGSLILTLSKRLNSDPIPDTHLSSSPDPDDAELALENQLKVIVTHSDKWMTAIEWRNRIREFKELADIMENFKEDLASETEEEFNDSRILRFIVRILLYVPMIALERVISITRGWGDYLDELRSRDFRWRHLAWLETVTAHAEKIAQDLGGISSAKKKEKYLSRCELRFSEEPDVASWSAEDASDKKSLGARMMLPFAVPVIMAAVTPLIQHGLGLTH